jgi:phage-related protein
MSGKEPVKDWLKEQTREDKRTIGEHIKEIEFTWPVGYPQVTKMDNKLWEARIQIREKICRIFFTVYKRDMVLVHSIIKKSQKTPGKDLELAKKRCRMVWTGGENEKI